MKLRGFIYIAIVIGSLTAFIKLIVDGNTGAAVGLCFFIFGCALTYENLVARLLWRQTQARIIKLDFKNERMIFEYEVDSTQFEGKSVQDPNYHKVGKQIDIRYDPSKPEVSRHVSATGDLFGWSFIALGLSLLMLSLSL